jgi:phosphatidylethanolamine-binding protein (PEBP) family uncharacterized protein
MRDITVLGISMLALVLTSCGGGSSAPTAREIPALAFGSPAVSRTRVIPAHYKCDSRTNWLPLVWGAVPAGTHELVLYMVRFGTPHANASGAVSAPIDAESIVLGLKPTLHKLSLGKFPQGAKVAIHKAQGQPVSICPAKGVNQNLLFRLYALPQRLATRSSLQKTNLVSVMSKEALEAGTFIASYRPA